MTSANRNKCLAAALAAVILPAAAQQNPLARPPDRGDASGLDGRWNGADLEDRSNCRASQNDGRHGTYAQYDFAVDTTNHFIGMSQTGVTGLNCTWGGNYTGDAFHIDWSGEYSCTDGKSGSFHSKSFLITAKEMSIQLSIKLDGSESCDIDSVLGGSRY